MNRGKNAFISHTKKYITVEDFYKRKKKWSSLHSYKILNATSPFSRRVSFFSKVYHIQTNTFFGSLILLLYFSFIFDDNFFHLHIILTLNFLNKKEKTGLMSHDGNLRTIWTYIHKSTLSICCNDATSCLVPNAELHSALKSKKCDILGRYTV